MNNNIKPIARRYQLTWRQLQPKPLTLLQLIWCGGIIENATPNK